MVRKTNVQYVTSAEVQLCLTPDQQTKTKRETNVSELGAAELKSCQHQSQMDTI